MVIKEYNIFEDNQVTFNANLYNFNRYIILYTVTTINIVSSRYEMSSANIVLACVREVCKSYLIAGCPHQHQPLINMALLRLPT